MLKFRFRYSFHNLLVWLLLYIIVSPFLLHMPGAKIVFSLFISLVLFFAVYAMERRERLFKMAVALLGASLLLLWLDVLNIWKLPRQVDTALTMIYIGILIYSFSKHVFRARIVDSRLICAALCLYLFLGTFWGYLYETLYSLAPTSFSGDVLAADAYSMVVLRQHFQYFSFVTLTTLGYGDIVPRTPGASALCVSEAIMGQFFMAVLVARLVGIQVAQHFASGGKNEELRRYFHDSQGK